MSALTDAVRSALDTQDLLGAADGVKQLVCDELARVDPTAAIRRTEYFNHSYVPDVVVVWPSRPPREVFLRFMAPDTVGEDVARIGGSGPVMVDLSLATSPSRHEETVRAAGEPT
ncbi:MAG TPA: hypothetical protein VGS21_02160, partial [Acidimicrobiales bacterium]|nr:hypothetical protein [Acidimicrobiales bacterium]